MVWYILACLDLHGSLNVLWVQWPIIFIVPDFTQIFIFYFLNSSWNKPCLSLHVSLLLMCWKRLTYIITLVEFFSHFVIAILNWSYESTLSNANKWSSLFGLDEHHHLYVLPIWLYWFFKMNFDWGVYTCVDCFLLPFALFVLLDWLC